MSIESGDSDIAIVGGGPAGLSAALILGRCCRAVTVFDANQPRNAPSRAMHGFLSRDGIRPATLRSIALRQLEPYPLVKVRAGSITQVRRRNEGFILRHENGATHHCRKLLLATGSTDVLPEIPGLRRFYGHSAFHCPQCDGWEQRGKPLVAYGKNCTAWDFAGDLLTWSRDITLCSDQTHRLTRGQESKLERLGIRVVKKKVARLSGRGRRISKVILEGGGEIPCAAFFFCSKEQARSELAIQLGAKITAAGRVEHDSHYRTSIPGCYTAGNTTDGLQMAIVAAAEGANAAYCINKALNEEMTAEEGAKVKR